MQSQRKMLRSGTAARSLSVSVRSAGARCAVAIPITRSLLRAGAEHDAGIEIRLAPDEPARNLGTGARVDDESEPVARGIGDCDQHGVGERSQEDRVDLADTAEHWNALKPAPGETAVVVDEADDLLA